MLPHRDGLSSLWKQKPKGSFLHMQVAWVMVFHYNKGRNTTSKVSFYCWRNSCASTPVSWFPLNYKAIVVSYYNKIPHRCFQDSGLDTSSFSVLLQMSLDLCSGSFLAKTCTMSYLQSPNPYDCSKASMRHETKFIRLGHALKLTVLWE